MKLLLTSGGLKNQSLINALKKMVDIPLKDVRVAFITTASNKSIFGKAYAMQQWLALKKIGFRQVKTVDMSKLERQVWLSMLKDADVIYVNGGNTTHLMRHVTQSGLQDELPELLKSRVYVGVSAGSYIVTPDTRLNSDNVPEVLPALNYVDFGIQAHYKSTIFKLAKNLERVKKRTKDCPYSVYVLDDQSAIKVMDGKIEVISEGEWLLLNRPK